MINKTKKRTKEFKMILELKEVHEELENYIDAAIKLLMDCGMTEQETRFLLSLKDLKKFLNNTQEPGLDGQGPVNLIE
jgi:ERCC4-related helicase